MPDDDYLTPAEFAALPFTAQCAVWTAHAKRQIDSIRHGNICRYRRVQVRKLVAETCAECKGTGLVDVDHCNCAVGPSGYYGMHERYCGTDMCPNGCWDVLNPAEATA